MNTSVAFGGKITAANFYVLVLTLLGWMLHLISTMHVVRTAEKYDEHDISFHKHHAKDPALVNENSKNKDHVASGGALFALMARSFLAVWCCWIVMTNIPKLLANHKEKASSWEDCDTFNIDDSTCYTDYLSTRAAWIAAAIAVQIVGFVLLNILGACCSKEVVQGDDETGMAELQRMVSVKGRHLPADPPGWSSR